MAHQIWLPFRFDQAASSRPWVHRSPRRRELQGPLPRRRSLRCWREMRGSDPLSSKPRAHPGRPCILLCVNDLEDRIRWNCIDSIPRCDMRFRTIQQRCGRLRRSGWGLCPRGRDPCWFSPSLSRRVPCHCHPGAEDAPSRAAAIRQSTQGWSATSVDRRSGLHIRPPGPDDRFLPTRDTKNLVAGMTSIAREAPAPAAALEPVPGEQGRIPRT